MKYQGAVAESGRRTGLKILSFPSNPDWLIATHGPAVAKPVAISGRHAWDTVPDKVRVVAAMAALDS